MNESTRKPRGLGRGLSALMADVAPAADVRQRGGRDMAVPIEQVQPNPDQPRRSFDDSLLEELAESIRRNGIIQPLIVRRLGEDTPPSYQIVAGERRWRAAQKAGLHDIPVIVRDFSDTEVLEVAIVENIQRADLNAIDEAAGYRQLIEKFGHTQAQLSEVLGKSRSHIANQMRLLTLPEVVQRFVVDGRLSAGHARAIVTADDPEALAAKIVKQGLSVREAERLAKKPATGTTTKSKSEPATEKDADTKALEGDLSATLGMKVTIDHRPGQEGGKMILNYKSLEQLDDLMRALSQ